MILPGPAIVFERSLVFEPSEFEPMKFDCMLYVASILFYLCAKFFGNLLICLKIIAENRTGSVRSFGKCITYK